MWKGQEVAAPEVVGQKVAQKVRWLLSIRLARVGWRCECDVDGRTRDSTAPQASRVTAHVAAPLHRRTTAHCPAACPAPVLSARPPAAVALLAPAPVPVARIARGPPGDVGTMLQLATPPYHAAPLATTTQPTQPTRTPL